MTKMNALTVAAAAAVIISGGSVAAASVQSHSSPHSATYGYEDFYGIPSLGHETVSGTGCGGDGSIGDTIPDGLWRGYVRSWNGASLFDSTSVQFDLVCVYRGTINPDLISRWRRDHPGQPDPWVADGFMVNNSPRTRSVQTADQFWGHGTLWGADGTCPFAQPSVPFDQSHDVWISIFGGQAQWVVSSCEGPGSGIPPTTTPPASAPAGGSGYTFPYADFWDVPQLGSEPVRGSGCGADGSIGDTIPDGLWYGYIASLGPSSLEFDLMCMYTGAAAQQKCDEFAAANPDFASPPCWPGIGFLENNNSRTRTVTLAANYVQADAVWGFEGHANWPGDGCAPPVDPTVDHPFLPAPSWSAMPSWLYIVGGQGQYTLTECLHD